VALEQINEQQCRLAALSRKMDEAQARIDELFQAVGAPDEEAFREQGRRSEYFRDLTRKGRVILEGLFTESGCNDEADLRNRLADCDWEQLKQDRSLLQAARDALRQEAQELAGREGRLQQEIETLESAEETERLLAEKESLLAQLDEAVREWTHLRLASALLERTLRMYESDKQPKVLERSSELFRMITGGAFSRILFSLSEDSIKAERPDGARLDEGILSRGTLEQVYLAVRLAYLEVYHPKDLPFPLLMDDILVNFDVERARNAANALVQFSQKMGLQVFFFTCHRHVADLFPPNVVEVRLGPARADIDTACSEIAAGAAWVR
jgi:uncharacterized protein YhaN